MNQGRALWGRVVLSALVLAWAAPTPRLSAQANGTIRGSVESSITHDRLAGVTVSLGEDFMVTRTDDDGRFVLSNVPPGVLPLRLVLLPDFVSNMEFVEVNEGDTTDVSLELTPVVVVLDELNIHGEPTYSGATVKIYAEGEAARLAADGSVVDLLTRDFSGVSVIHGSGQVGSGSRILIRGVNSLTLPGDPIVYVDDVRVGGPAELEGSETQQVVNTLDMIPASAVQRIEVLRGPAATRFGLGSSNGVILVWTQR